MAQSLNNLATLSLTLGRHDDALRFLSEALAIWRTALGTEHPSFAQSLSNLGVVHSAMGHFEEAESIHREALEVRRRILGASHPDVAQSLYNLAWVHAVTKRQTEALGLLHEAAAIDDRMLGQVFSVGSESQRMAYLENVRLHLHLLLSLVIRTMTAAPDGVRAAFDLVLRRKAIGLEVLAVQRDTVLAGRYPALEQSLRELSALRVRIARTLLSGQGGGAAAEPQPRFAEWEAERDRRESELARQIPELDFERRLRSVECQAVARTLPPDACLVELIRYYDFDFDTGDVTHARYAAFVLAAHPRDTVQLIDLGQTEPIERPIGVWRRAVTGHAERRRSDSHTAGDAATNDVREDRPPGDSRSRSPAGPLARNGTRGGRPTARPALRPAPPRPRWMPPAPGRA